MGAVISVEFEVTHGWHLGAFGLSGQKNGGFAAPNGFNRLSPTYMRRSDRTHVPSAPNAKVRSADVSWTRGRNNFD
jgi:hypothetical protein